MKRRREYDDESSDLFSHSSTQKSARFTDDQTLTSNTAGLPWNGVFTSILGVEALHTNSGDDLSANDINTVLRVESDDTTNSSPESSALIAFSQNIETWAKHTVDIPENDDILDDELCRAGLSQVQETGDDTMQCFGMIHACDARLHGNMQALNIRLAQMSSRTKWAEFQLSFNSNICFLFLEDDPSYFGQLRDGLEGPLQRICRISPKVRVIAYILIEDCMRCIGRAKKSQEAIIQVDLNIYGPVTIYTQVGQSLSSDRLYLQHPRYRDPLHLYKNPHMLKFDDIDMEMLTEEIQDVMVSNRDPEQIQKAIDLVCDGETRERQVEIDISEIDIKTTLFPHQRSALQFMVEREIGPISEGFKLWQYKVDEHRSGYQHAVTGLWTIQPVPETGGGILADDMGMGKTLSTLSLISKRMNDGRVWSQSENVENGDRHTRQPRTRATLIVLSSLLVMIEWCGQIKTHLGTSLKWFKYHGKRRNTQVKSIYDSDIVVTTYHTLATERRARKSPLKSVKWFRIVLDEAHTIRRQATTLYAAVAELDACHRWCLTGTPIQNKLDDLGALLAFIRADPFDSISMFRKYVKTPFEHDLGDAKDKLALVLNSICMRRKKERLHLPPMKEIPRVVELTAGERKQYDQTLESMSWILTHGSREKFSGTPFGKFQIQLQLRRLCNHGTFQKPFTSPKDDLQTQREDIISSIGKEGELMCSYCDEWVPILDTNCTLTRDLSCKHILCNGCVAQLSDDMTSKSIGTGCLCCASMDKRDSGNSFSSVGPVLKGSEFNDSGYSSKMEMLMRDVGQGISEKKSIIFSIWTRSLDLVEKHLKRTHIEFTRIDGDIEPNKRQSILDAFASNENIRVLLMTTGTGAYGLNLTAANRIFILEPQWNPSIENQAIARAQRPPQKQSVQVFRYIVRGTVEEDIQTQQGKKLEVAEMGFHEHNSDLDGS